MEIQTPPDGIDPGLAEYLFRQFKIVEDELNSTNGIAIVKELPDRPRKGKLYFVDDALYFWVPDDSPEQGEWKQVAVMTPEIPYERKKWTDV